MYSECRNKKKCTGVSALTLYMQVSIAKKISQHYCREESQVLNGPTELAISMVGEIAATR